jgi:hypothetical protein
MKADMKRWLALFAILASMTAGALYVSSLMRSEARTCYRRVQLGMTEEEVREIVGRQCTFRPTLDRMEWVFKDDELLVVVLDPHNQMRVSRKSIKSGFWNKSEPD